MAHSGIVRLLKNIQEYSALTLLGMCLSAAPQNSSQEQSPAGLGIQYTLCTRAPGSPVFRFLGAVEDTMHHCCGLELPKRAAAAFGPRTTLKLALSATLGTRPAKAKVQKLCESLTALTTRKTLQWDPEEIVGRFNSRLRGWANDFCLGSVSKAYRAVERHAAGRLRKWLCRKHKVPGQGTARFPDEYLFQTRGLVRITCLPRRHPQRKRE